MTNSRTTTGRPAGAGRSSASNQKVGSTRTLETVRDDDGRVTSRVRRTVLPGGLRVITEQLAGARSASIGVWVGVGSRDESPTLHGCSHFLEHLLFKGTGSRSARDIAESLDAIGGEMNAFTSKEVTCFYARVLDRDLPTAFEVLADMVVDAANRPSDVEAERQVVLSELDIHYDTPDDLVHSDFAEAVLGNHPLALETLGTVESVVGLDRDTIHAYYLEHYRPGSLVVAAAGNVDHDRVVALADTVYEPLWKKANDLGAVIYIHPAHPLGVEAMEKYWLMPLVGFLMDTTLAAAHLVFAGVPERYPNITWVLCHMGGAIPYLAERLDRGYEAFADCRANISRAPSTYLKTFYYDTVNFDTNCIELAIKFAGAGHILAGSDYPHQIGSIPKMLDAVGRLPVSPAEREGIAGRNAAALLEAR